MRLNCRATHTARWYGHRAGRAGLSVEEVADTPYLVRLRQQAERDRLAIATGLADALASLQTQAGGLDPEVLRARCRALAEEAEAADRVRVAEYERVCAAFGDRWRRRHRDRHFAHLGWRCPRLRSAPAGDVDDTAR